MSVMRLSTLSALVFGAALAMASTATLAQNRTFSFAYDQPKSSGYGAGAEMFDKKLKELSKGTLSINQYPSAQLGTEAQTMQKVQTGDIDFVMLSTANASTAQPESGVFSIHFIFRDEKHAIKVLGDPKVIAAMKELYAAKIKGAHMLGLGSQGLRHMYGKKPVQKVADLKGVKIDDSLLKPSEKEIVEDLIVAAHADARRKAEGVLQEKMKEVTGGLPLPPGLGLT